MVSGQQNLKKMPLLSLLSFDSRSFAIAYSDLPSNFEVNQSPNKLKDEKPEFYPHQIDHDSIIVDGHTGSITFDAIRRLMKHDISLQFSIGMATYL